MRVLTLAYALYMSALVDQNTRLSAYSAVCVSGRYFTVSLMYSVKRVQLSELQCGIPSLRHSFVDVTPFIWLAIVLSVESYLSIGTCCYVSLHLSSL